MCSSEKFGQEHAHLLAVRAQRAVAGDTPDIGTSRADYEEVSKAELIRNATLKVYEGAPHGMCTTLKD
jgi:hypothetical protein